MTGTWWLISQNTDFNSQESWPFLKTWFCLHIPYKKNYNAEVWDLFFSTASAHFFSPPCHTVLSHWTQIHQQNRQPSMENDGFLIHDNASFVMQKTAEIFFKNAASTPTLSRVFYARINMIYFNKTYTIISSVYQHQTKSGTVIRDSTFGRHWQCFMCFCLYALLFLIRPAWS